MRLLGRLLVCRSRRSARASSLAAVAAAPCRLRPARRRGLRGGRRRIGRGGQRLRAGLALSLAPPRDARAALVDDALLQEPARQVPAGERLAVRRPRRPRSQPGRARSEGSSSRSPPRSAIRRRRRRGASLILGSVVAAGLFCRLSPGHRARLWRSLRSRERSLDAGDLRRARAARRDPSTSSSGASMASRSGRPDARSSPSRFRSPALHRRLRPRLARRPRRLLRARRDRGSGSGDRRAPRAAVSARLTRSCLAATSRIVLTAIDLVLGSCLVRPPGAAAQRPASGRSRPVTEATSSARSETRRRSTRRRTRSSGDCSTASCAGSTKQLASLAPDLGARRRLRRRSRHRASRPPPRAGPGARASTPTTPAGRGVALPKRSESLFPDGSAYDLPFADGSFDLVCAIEVLEHLERPRDALAEMSRVARRALLLSVPNEPGWRISHLLAGRNVRALATRRAHQPLVEARLRRARLGLTDGSRGRRRVSVDACRGRRRENPAFRRW